MAVFPVCAHRDAPRRLTHGASEASAARWRGDRLMKADDALSRGCLKCRKRARLLFTLTGRSVCGSVVGDADSRNPPGRDQAPVRCLLAWRPHTTQQNTTTKCTRGSGGSVGPATTKNHIQGGARAPPTAKPPAPKGDSHVAVGQGMSYFKAPLWCRIGVSGLGLRLMEGVGALAVSARLE